MEILCVNNDALSREIIEGMLAVAGVKTVKAADAQACLSL